MRRPRTAIQKLRQRLKDADLNNDTDFAAEHIRLEAAKIRETWTEEERHKRAGIRLEPLGIMVIRCQDLGPSSGSRIRGE